MTPGTDRPVVAVLSAADVPPPDLDSLRDRIEVRATTAQRLPQDLQGAQVLLLWDFLSGALQAAWPSADDLRWVHVAAAGVDRLLFPQLAASKVVVTNAHGVFDGAIAEFVLAAILADAKDLHRSYADQLTHTWDHRETRSLRRRKALVVGTGAIGR